MVGKLGLVIVANVFHHSLKHIKVQNTKLFWSNKEKQNPNGPSGCIDFSHFHDTYVNATKKVWISADLNP